MHECDFMSKQEKLSSTISHSFTQFCFSFTIIDVQFEILKYFKKNNKDN